MTSKKKPECQFDHIHIYVNKLHSLAYYKQLEGALSELSLSFERPSLPVKSANCKINQKPSHSCKYRLNESEVSDLRTKWKAILQKQLFAFREYEEIADVNVSEYKSHNQDIIEQLIVSLGWRISSECHVNGVSSFLVESKSEFSARIIVSAPLTGKVASQTNELLRPVFDRNKIIRYFMNHNGYQGISVLSFDLSVKQRKKFGLNIENVFDKYKKFHKNLIVNSGIGVLNLKSENNNVRVFEAYAYYRDFETRQPDRGTILRYVERENSDDNRGYVRHLPVFPMMTKVRCEYDSTSVDLCFDHWVSNVIDRESFLSTLSDVLDFDIKADFNAGVVAAGKAKIESTVTGNDVPLDDFSLDSCEVSAQPNPQVYLPVNNALSKHGHVHQFLNDIGQGVQHVASKVDNLVSLIERINLFREITGRGFKMLKIPRVYYGVLDVAKTLLPPFEDIGGTSFDFNSTVKSLFQHLVINKVVSKTGIVDIDLDKARLDKILDEYDFFVQGRSRKSLCLEEKHLELDYEKIQTELSMNILRARYINIYNLVGDEFDEATYMSIVRNQILLDTQGYDVLMQIFTAKILQGKPDSEAPFFEFIQRRCHTFEMKEIDSKRVKVYKKPKPGCGGFGIRNFLTLFLSIEVSKALDELQSAEEEENYQRVELCKAKVQLYSEQLDASNPILNSISEIMTSEANNLEELKLIRSRQEISIEAQERINYLEKQQEELNILKQDQNKRLQTLSSDFALLFDNVS